MMGKVMGAKSVVSPRVNDLLRHFSSIKYIPQVRCSWCVSVTFINILYINTITNITTHTKNTENKIHICTTYHISVLIST